MGTRASLIAAVGAAIALGAVAAIVAVMWATIGDVEISLAGWIAMTLGVLVTLALGVGLMTLVFISSRRGYDEPDRDRC